MVNKEHHHEEISMLAKCVLSNPKVAVLVKTQFARNSVNNLYSDDHLISEAIRTGRLIDLCHGDGIRNDVYPTQVALSSDICVGNMVGATASLEVALCGSKSVLVNEYNVRPHWEYLVADQNIVFPDLAGFLQIIEKCDGDIAVLDGIGDWGAVIDQFDAYPDMLSIQRLQAEIL